MYSKRIKEEHMKQLADYRKELYKHPKLHSLFLELTASCNLKCRHCGSSCGDVEIKNTLSKEEICSFLLKISKEFPLDKLRLCITGGEPLLRSDFFDIMNYANELGFRWGMTSNGILIDEVMASKLKEAHMRTISISLDGLKDTHDWFRQKEGCFEEALRGIRALVNSKAFEHVQVTTVVHKKNIYQLQDMYNFLINEGIDSWRVINIEPIGRAVTQSELLLDADDYKKMFKFIKNKRSKNAMEVAYGCSHYLGYKLEKEIRPWYFLCNAGIYTASIMYNGDIGACLDIERRPELIQGNIRTDDFKFVWENKFEQFRTQYRSCNGCEHEEFCACDSFHTWNFDENKPNVCFKGILF